MYRSHGPNWGSVVIGSAFHTRARTHIHVRSHARTHWRTQAHILVHLTILFSCYFAAHIVWWFSRVPCVCACLLFVCECVRACAFRLCRKLYCNLFLVYVLVLWRSVPFLFCLEYFRAHITLMLLILSTFLTCFRCVAFSFRCTLYMLTDLLWYLCLNGTVFFRDIFLWVQFLFFWVLTDCLIYFLLMSRVLWTSDTTLHPTMESAKGIDRRCLTTFF